MSEAPIVREEYIAAAAVQIVLKRLLETGKLNSHDVYWEVRRANPGADGYTIAILFNQQLQDIGLRYLTDRN